MKFNFKSGAEADFDEWVYDGCKKAFDKLDINFTEPVLSAADGNEENEGCLTIIL